MDLTTFNCGPYWSDGKLQSSTLYYKNKPVSKLDVLCKAHDYAYALSSDPTWRLRADNKFVREALKLSGLKPNIFALLVATNRLPSLSSLPDFINSMVDGIPGAFVKESLRGTPGAFIPEWLDTFPRTRRINSGEPSAQAKALSLVQPKGQGYNPYGPDDMYDTVYVADIDTPTIYSTTNQPVNHDYCSLESMADDVSSISYGSPINLHDPRFMLRRKRKRKRISRQ